MAEIFHLRLKNNTRAVSGNKSTTKKASFIRGFFESNDLMLQTKQDFSLNFHVAVWPIHSDQLQDVVLINSFLIAT